MKNYIQDTIKELTKEITIKDNRIISTPDFSQCIRNLGHKKVNYLWHILHPNDRSLDGYTHKEYEDAIRNEYYYTSLCRR